MPSIPQERQHRTSRDAASLFIPNPLSQERQNNARLDDKAFFSVCMVATQATRHPTSVDYTFMAFTSHATVSA